MDTTKLKPASTHFVCTTEDVRFPQQLKVKLMKCKNLLQQIFLKKTTQDQVSLYLYQIQKQTNNNVLHDVELLQLHDLHSCQT